MSGVIDFFIPREKKFFEHLQKQIGLLETCALKLYTTTNKSKPKEAELKKLLHFIEEKSDKSTRISRQIIDELHQTFITPIDREEIQNLSVNINRVNDTLEKIASSILFFKLKKLNIYFVKQLSVIGKIVHVLTLIFVNPLSQRPNQLHIEKIHSLEVDGDKLYKQGMSYIFNNNTSPIDIIKQKELFDIAEDAVDEMEYISDIIQTVLINHS